MLLRKCAVRDSGLFDENYFMYFEDIDICLRMKRSGWSETEMKTLWDKAKEQRLYASR